MIRSIIVTIILLFATSLLQAAEVIKVDDDFMKQLQTIKNPFEDGFPAVVIVAPKIVRQKPVHRGVPKLKPKPKPHKEPVIKLPEMRLDGVIVSDEMHQAIIDGQMIAVNEEIKHARVTGVNKDGVDLLYKGKKFFIKIE